MLSNCLIPLKFLSPFSVLQKTNSSLTKTNKKNHKIRAKKVIRSM